MSLALAILVVIGFALILDRTGLLRYSAEAGSRARESLRLASDKSLGDDVKEERLQAEAVRLFGLLGRILLLGCLAGILPLGAVWLFGLFGVGSLSQVLLVLQRVDFILATAVVGGVGFWIARRIRHP